MKLSSLGKTWILDLDGTICKHNGYKINGHDILLSGAKEFFEQIGAEDKVIFVTSREKAYAQETENFLQENQIKYEAIIYGMPYGERILINDRKPSGLNTAIAINTKRDEFCLVQFEIDESL